MTRKEQYYINLEAEKIWKQASEDYYSEDFGNIPCKRLRSCNALVYETSNFYILRSYDTMVAAIDKRNNYCCDMLRKEYKFTRTSAMHIAKFIRDYTPYEVWNCPRYTWRPID